MATSHVVAAPLEHDVKRLPWPSSDFHWLFKIVRMSSSSLWCSMQREFARLSRVPRNLDGFGFCYAPSVWDIAWLGLFADTAEKYTLLSAVLHGVCCTETHFWALFGQKNIMSTYDRAGLLVLVPHFFALVILRAQGYLHVFPGTPVTSTIMITIAPGTRLWPPSYRRGQVRVVDRAFSFARKTVRDTVELATDKSWSNHTSVARGCWQEHRVNLRSRRSLRPAILLFTLHVFPWSQRLQRLQILIRCFVFDRVQPPVPTSCGSTSCWAQCCTRKETVDQRSGRSSKTCDTPLHLFDYPLDSATSTILTLSRIVHFSEECVARGWAVTEPSSPSLHQPRPAVRGFCGSGVRGLVRRKSWKGSMRRAFSYIFSHENNWRYVSSK